jgi:hypothetical protein
VCQHSAYTSVFNLIFSCLAAGMICLVAQLSVLYDLRALLGLLNPAASALKNQALVLHSSCSPVCLLSALDVGINIQE